MENSETRIVFILVRQGKLQEGCAALIREIPYTMTYIFEEWYLAENQFSNIKPKLIVIEAAVFTPQYEVDIIHLIPKGVRTMVLEDNPLFIDQWKAAGADMVVLVGELAPVLFSKIIQLLSLD